MEAGGTQSLAMIPLSSVRTLSFAFSSSGIRPNVPRSISIHSCAATDLDSQATETPRLKNSLCPSHDHCSTGVRFGSASGTLGLIENMTLVSDANRTSRRSGTEGELRRKIVPVLCSSGVASVLTREPGTSYSIAVAPGVTCSGVRTTTRGSATASPVGQIAGSARAFATSRVNAVAACCVPRHPAVTMTFRDLIQSVPAVPSGTAQKHSSISPSALESDDVPAARRRLRAKASAAICLLWNTPRLTLISPLPSAARGMYSTPIPCTETCSGGPACRLSKKRAVSTPVTTGPPTPAAGDRESMHNSTNVCCVSLGMRHSVLF